jgi:hypothetical protein
MTSLRVHPTLLAATLAISLAFILSAEPGGAESASETGAKRHYLVKIHADWCVACTRLQPLWKRLGEKCGDSARLVLLDVTDRETTAHSAREAARLGLGEFFDAHKSQTGTIAVIETATREPVAVFRGEMDFGEYEAVLTNGRGECGS